MNDTRQAAPTVFVIDDDAAMRAAIRGLLKSVGLPSESYGTAEEFPRSKRPDGPSCLVLDVSLPGVSGLDFQRQLAGRGHPNSHHLHYRSWRYSDDGEGHEIRCLGVLTKPFQDQDLLDAIRQALDRDRVARQKQSNLAELRKRYEALTAREARSHGTRSVEHAQ